MCTPYTALQWIALLCIAPFVALLDTPLDRSLDTPLNTSLDTPFDTLHDKPLDESCRKLAVIYDPLYRMAVHEGNTFRPLAIEGQPTRVVVWGAAGGSTAAAAAALLLVALRYGLGYDADFKLQNLNVCDAEYEKNQLWVAPAVHVPRCKDINARLLHMSGGETRVPLELLLARVAAGCMGADDVLTAYYDDDTLRSCINLTLLEFMKLTSKFSSCNWNASDISGAAKYKSFHVVLVANDTESDELYKLHTYIRSNNISLVLLRLDTKCFFPIFKHLEEENRSFLFIDRDLRSYKPGMVSVLLKSDKKDKCPILNTNNMRRIGDGDMMRAYAPQIADIVERFCPSLQQLKEVLKSEASNSYDIERNACKWALKNNNTFKSLITNVKKSYRLFFYFCNNDPFNTEYIKTMNNVRRTTMQHDEFNVSLILVDNTCHDEQIMREQFSDMIEKTYNDIMGVIAWSSSEGIKDIARYANQYQVPLILVGPITSDTPIGSASSAVNGKLKDLVHFFRTFLVKCRWTRLAILSDGSTYAKAFSNYLLHGDELEYVERVVTSKTAINILKSLRIDDVRIFMVNTNSSVAVKILQSAVTLGMTPPQYAWIVREWNPTKVNASANWGDMSHFSLGTEWRGIGGKANRNASGGIITLRERLENLWPQSAWPALAASLVDAMLLLDYSFTEFQRLYSTNSYNMRSGRNFSQIYEKISMPGIGRKLSFRNGIVESVIVYLEHWRGATRNIITSWDMRDVRHLEIWNGNLCGVPVRDRPYCSFKASGKSIVQRCYDIPLFSFLAVLMVLPIVLVLARRARLKRLAVRDLNLLAHILESKQLNPVVHGNSLCIHQKIGTGNFGSVYLATLRQTKEKAISVAAKELRDESDKEEYLQEAGTLQQLDHDNIVKFVGICVSNGSLLILMEYAFYGDLLQYLQRRRHLAERADMGAADKDEARHVSARALTRLAREAAAALQYLAHCKLVHRDIRAANCLIDKQRTLKLADFGMARKLGDNLEYTTIRRAKFPVLWMAPESLSRGTFSTASDIWALGVLYLELVTLGRRPYGTTLPHQVWTYVCLGGQPPLPPDASMQTISLVTACWQHQSEKRATVSDVVRYLTREPRALRPALLPAPVISAAVVPPFLAISSTNNELENSCSGELWLG